MTDKIMKLADAYAEYRGHSEYVHCRAALSAAIKAEQDYTTEVISERDAWKESADEQAALINEIANERDRLRKAAQMAYQALGYAMGCIENMTDLEEMKMQPVLEALRKELGE